MIESREQIGHRRMITSAPASAQSAFSWLGVAEREIKTIVPIEPFPGYCDRHKILPGAEPSPFQSPPCQLLPPAGTMDWPVKGPEYSNVRTPRIMLTAPGTRRIAKTGRFLQLQPFFRPDGRGDSRRVWLGFPPFPPVFSPFSGSRLA